MPNISTTDAQPLFAKRLAARYSDNLKPKAFLRSFFTEVEADSKEISIQVERDSESIAVDVLRGTEGNRNTFDRSTEKIFIPPYYNEYFDMTQIDLYDALYANPEISDVNFGKFLDNANAKLEKLMDKIDRAYELQCAQVFTTGIVTLKQGINIDFKRKAGSLVDLGSGAYWTVTTVDPNDSLLAGCKFLRETGKMEGSVVNAIFAEDVLPVYLANPAVKARGVIFNYSLDNITMSQRSALGQSFHGEISVGSYRVRIWTYPEVYKNAAGATVPYLDATKVYLVPEKLPAILSYAAVPQLLSTGIAPRKGKFLAYDFIDERATSHLLGVKSAGVAIPVGVDLIYTVKVKA